MSIVLNRLRIGTSKRLVLTVLKRLRIGTSKRLVLNGNEPLGSIICGEFHD
jgi:hypothetical protein